MHRILPLLPLLPLLATAGCPFGGDMCTAIGCIDAYELTVTAPAGTALGDFVVTAEVDGETLDADCAADGSAYPGEFGCGGGVISFPYTESPVELIVENVVGTLGWSGTLDLDFDAVYPNGEDCDPICHQGAGELILEAL